jgi:chaperone required for assembly of F1-ATPase
MALLVAAEWEAIERVYPQSSFPMVKILLTLATITQRLTRKCLILDIVGSPSDASKIPWKKPRAPHTSPLFAHG